MTGYARGTTATFVFNTEDGRYARVPTTFRRPAFSRSGNVPYGSNPTEGDGVHVISWRLDQARFEAWPDASCARGLSVVSFLSDDGTRLATYDSESLSVFDLATGALLASAHAPGSAWTAEGLFVTPDHSSSLRLRGGKEPDFDLRLRSRSEETAPDGRGRWRWNRALLLHQPRRETPDRPGSRRRASRPLRRGQRTGARRHTRRARSRRFDLTAFCPATASRWPRSMAARSAS